MDSPKVRLFIKDLIYDLDTVQYLLDYGRIKETLPVVDKILDDIVSLRKTHLGNDLNHIFCESFWDKKLPAGTSFSQIHAEIKNYSSRLPAQEDLSKMGYMDFIKNLFIWSDENVPKLKNALKTPLRKKIEKMILWAIAVLAGIILIYALLWMFFTRDWGLRGDFYQGKFEKYLYSGHKKTIDFIEDPALMDLRIPHDNFSVRWQGSLLAPKDGKYTLFTVSDDGARTSVDSKPLFDDWGPHPPHEAFKEISLAQGPHSITVEYYQIGGGSTLRLYWRMDGGKKEIIPAKYLRH